MNDTDYLVSSENNKIRLQGSIEESKGIMKNEGTFQYNEVTGEVHVDVEYMANLLDGLDNSELFYIKSVCDMLIAKSNL